MESVHFIPIVLIYPTIFLHTGMVLERSRKIIDRLRVNVKFRYSNYAASAERKNPNTKEARDHIFFRNTKEWSLCEHKRMRYLYIGR